ncbi:bifunctional lysylphosphatidylglycerol flippase/synthetase MprF [Tomitella fengzijianii]|uniref:DUF2156 domain-containing protein n=1 Tax=Tomitella fengzijianii TaxID=2597660 RepID=A0A516WZR4_9ACTN|nr:DUF2156 domain-containing protein [Tomitella fengzijianii]QDQ96305.1 DUF2156 domain-containing protein [Tomitella fengzijianii]
MTQTAKDSPVRTDTPGDAATPSAEQPPETAENTRPGAAAVRIDAARRVLTAVPFTAVVTLVLLISGFASQGIWRPLRDASWYPDIADGVPGLRDGQWWTPVTGIPFGATPTVFIALIVLTPFVLGWAEWRLGTLRTVVVFLAGQILSVLAASGLIRLAALAPWPWADALALARDAGMSTALVACVAAATATLRSPWRLRVRAILIAYVAVSFLFVARFADVAHIVAATVVLPLADRFFSTSEHGFGPRTRREYRLVAAIGLLLIGVVRVIVHLSPADGPLGPTGADDSSLWSTLFTVAVVLALADQLRRGRRWAWWAAVGYGSLVIAATVLAIVFVVATGYESIGAVSAGTALLWLALVTMLVVGRSAFHAPARHRALRHSRDGDPLDDAKAALRTYGSNTMSWMITWERNEYLFLPQRGQRVPGVIGFQRHAGTVIALTDPVCTPEQVAEAVVELTRVSEDSAAIPCLFSVSQATADAAAAQGWRVLQIAEDTIMDLPGLEFKGKRWQNVRSALNKAAKRGMEFTVTRLSSVSAGVLAQVREISEQWVGEKDLPEMGFTLGTVEEALDDETLVALATDAEGTVQGVLSWLPVYGPAAADGSAVVRGWTLDIMRKRDGDGATHVMEFLIASSARHFQSEGAQFLSLSGAPLARAGDEAAQPVDRALELLGAAIEPFYGFRSLHRFKAKFNPRYEPVYLCCRDEADLPRIGVAIGRAYLPDATPRQLLAMARQ